MTGDAPKPVPLSQLSARQRVFVALSTALGLGFSPIMPGTVGSIPGLGLGLLIDAAGAGLASESAVLKPIVVVVLLALATAFAWWVIDRTEAAWHTHDDQRIVIDEVVGQAIVCAVVPLTWQWYLAAFVLFRLFDMTKPGFIGRIDRDVKGASGTLFDDVAAGLVAAAILAAVRYGMAHA